MKLVALLSIIIDCAIDNESCIAILAGLSFAKTPIINLNLEGILSAQGN